MWDYIKIEKRKERKIFFPKELLQAHVLRKKIFMQTKIKITS